MPVAGEALVRRILRGLAAGGVTDAVLNLHYRPETVEAAVGDGSDLGIRVRYSREDPILGTAGGPRRALPLIDADRFFLVNGDTLTDLDLEALESDHRRTGARVTMAVIPNPDPASYGGVIADDDGRVTGFSARGPSGRGRHFVGTQIVDASVFAELPADRAADTVGGIYPRMIAERPGSVRAYLCDATFHDIGTPADYLVTSLRLALDEGNPDRLRGRRSVVAEGARVVRSVLWDDVRVEAGAELTECIVGDGVRIWPGARFRRVAIVSAERVVPGAGDERVGELVVAPFAVKPAHEKALHHDAEAR
jgi:mannose-1-phosphate guanylyltransferase